MGAYLVRRFGLMVLTLFGISIIIFMLLRLTPGNIADILFDAGGFVDPADKARIEADLGLDRPIPVQYAKWIGGLLQGDLGISYQTERPALQEIAPRIPITARLAALALAFAVLLGVPFGVISAVKQDTKLDYVLRVISLTGLSMPAFWLGLLILMGFVAYFGTIPIYSDAPTGFWNALLMYSVPAAAVGFCSSALMMRLSLIPIALAASTKGCSRRLSVVARMTRAMEGTSTKAIARIVLRKDGPSAAAMMIAMTSSGRACIISRKRWVIRSNQPSR